MKLILQAREDDNPVKPSDCVCRKGISIQLRDRWAGSFSTGCPGCHKVFDIEVDEEGRASILFQLGKKG